MPNQKGFTPVIIILGTVLILGIASGAYYLGTRKISNPVQSSTSQPPSISQSTQNEIANGKMYTSIEGKYSVQYPKDWVLEVFKEKYPDNTSYDKGHTVFQTRPTTVKEKADDTPGLPVDMGTCSIKIITTESMRGTEYAKISEQDFFNPESSFWLKGNAGGGGPGYTYSIPEEVEVGGKRAIKQQVHPTTAYEWVGPNQISTNYHIWLGNSANEILEVTFTYDDKNTNKDALIKGFNEMLSTFKFTN